MLIYRLNWINHAFSSIYYDIVGPIGTGQYPFHGTGLVEIGASTVQGVGVAFVYA